MGLAAVSWVSGAEDTALDTGEEEAVFCVVWAEEPDVAAGRLAAEEAALEREETADDAEEDSMVTPLTFCSTGFSCWVMTAEVGSSWVVGSSVYTAMLSYVVQAAAATARTPTLNAT